MDGNGRSQPPRDHDTGIQMGLAQLFVMLQPILSPCTWSPTDWIFTSKPPGEWPQPCASIPAQTDATATRKMFIVSLSSARLTRGHHDAARHSLEEKPYRIVPRPVVPFSVGSDRDNSHVVGQDDDGLLEQVHYDAIRFFYEPLLERPGIFLS